MSKKVVSDFVKFIDAAPTAWHAVELMKKKLKKAGFVELREEASWKIKPGGKYFVTRNGSTLGAFIAPKKKPAKAFVLGSHTDSPCFRLKPNAEFTKENMVMWGVEVYGGPLLTSWLNRDLGIAGRIICEGKKGSQVKEHLVNITDAPVTIPQLAIHLDRNVNTEGLKLNKQTHLAAIASLHPKKKGTYLESLLKKHVKCERLLAADLFLYPLESCAFMGEKDELLAAPRIDNLASAAAVLEGMLACKKTGVDTLAMGVFWDNEEIGSSTAQGAGSPFFNDLLERVCLAYKYDREEYLRLRRSSLCVSVDGTHALHPNYPDAHEPKHQPLLGQGVAVKVNAQQRYASDAQSVSALMRVCQKNKIPMQTFVARGDMGCGSTIGPIHATQTGMPTVDIGLPQLSMHSVRELMACGDYMDLCKLSEAVLSSN